MVVPAGEVTASRSFTGCSPESRSMIGRADRGLHDQVVGDLPGQAEQDAGVDHRLDQEVEVRRAGAGERGHRVLLGLGHPDGPAERLEHLLGQRQVRRRWRAAPAEIAVIAWSTRAGVLVMTRTTGVPSGSQLGEEAGRQAGAERDDQLVGRHLRRRARPSASPASCGLTATASTSASATAASLSTTRMPYRAASSAARSGRRAVASSRSDRPAGAQQPGQHQLADLAGADHRDRVHRHPPSPSYPRRP